MSFSVNPINDSTGRYNNVEAFRNDVYLKQQWNVIDSRDPRNNTLVGYAVVPVFANQGYQPQSSATAYYLQGAPRPAHGQQHWF